MSTEIERNQDTVLEFLYEARRDSENEGWVGGSDISKATGLEPRQINDAVSLLESHSLVELQHFIGTAPYEFGMVKITSRGIYEVERRRATRPVETEIPVSDLRDMFFRLTARPPAPVGSPYGFTDVDWELVSTRKSNRNVLYVVLGCKFESEYYHIDELRENVENMFEHAVERYNKENPETPITLEFVPLHAGYGEHLFNEIARDIISSDIAVFETSDFLAPNVFIEIDVALTWGSRVLLIKREGCLPPLSDISGQTYVDYRDNAATFPDPTHEEKLYRMVERAIRKKS